MKGEKAFHPARFLALSFIAAIFSGTLLLLLPFMTTGKHISFLDALFTSTSAVCVTGLIVQDTSTYFTQAGQITILILLQLGGLGIMTFSTLILIMAGKKISIKDRIIIQEGFHHSTPKNVKSLIANIFLFTMSVEFLGALLLYLRWKDSFSGSKPAFIAIFHSISAFCNAGFSVFSNSLESFRDDYWVNTIIIILIVLGGLGFLVHLEGKENLQRLFFRKKIRITLHTKMVLIVTAVLIVLSWVFFLATEWNNALKGLQVSEKLMTALFQIITPRTAGFNTINIRSLSHAAIFLLLGLMFIGASPGSTGGGIKTSTVGVIGSFMHSKISARDSINLFKRSLPLSIITKAFTVLSLSISVIFLSSFILFLVQPETAMQDVFFEAFSAFGTVGLSLGLTPHLSAAGKIVIMLTMYIGRIGPLTLLLAFSRRRPFGQYEYAEESVMIG
ncbi:MAG: hypothetical protein JW755_08500 [Candidatus Aminicenantes bacterium]|nr:hypothetical protein [Candidatus Aminicenantes bacterium]